MTNDELRRAQEGTYIRREKTALALSRIAKLSSLRAQIRGLVRLRWLSLRAPNRSYDLRDKSALARP